MKTQLPFSTIQLLDTPLTTDQKLASFGLTNTLLNVTAEVNTPLIHFWTLPPTLILGLKDRHLYDLPAGLATATENGYDHFLRNSGGLAVVSDGGILNVSLFVPQTVTHYSVDAGYELMKSLVHLTFPTLTIESYEITRSYCPGDYDLSVDGKKIAGISQRRTANALVVMAYISVTGDQQFRGRMVRDFYETGLAGQANDWDFPDVDPSSMINVADAMHQPLTVAEVKSGMVNALQEDQFKIDTTSLPERLATPAFQTQYTKELARISKRQAGI
ncbi:ligase [Secundilactobacillus paracollinoides]|uniref:lipoate--protein ligase family protein n=1 Tax=Secundilactobacillus paracollinoides TaxID=240427 RepID=UPI00081AA739|nr:lipoate--protein ligase family protein [Secundilactobacillus paracollinoides]ANZ63052.1 ligase [Secundilactobacillus paracollinoides]